MNTIIATLLLALSATPAASSENLAIAATAPLYPLASADAWELKAEYECPSPGVFDATAKGVCATLAHPEINMGKKGKITAFWASLADLKAGKKPQTFKTQKGVLVRDR